MAETATFEEARRVAALEGYQDRRKAFTDLGLEPR
jgi:hypothetical protein